MSDSGDSGRPPGEPSFLNLSTDPEGDLPRLVLQALEDFTLAASPEVGLDRLVRLSETIAPVLFDEPRDSMSVRIRETLQLERAPDASRLWDVLDTAILSDQTAYEFRMNALYDLILNWMEFYSDEEKLAGHLLLKHGLEREQILASSPTELHARLHERGGVV